MTNPSAAHDCMPNGRTASVVIRNLNEARDLGTLLAVLARQTPVAPEVIVVDNESSDESVAVAARYGAKVLHLPRAEFTYGRALNLGIAAASGDVCVLLSAHALPLGPDFIRTCVTAFDDASVAAVRCVHVGKRSEFTDWFDPQLLDRTATVDDAVSLGPLASGCAIRRAVWSEIRFDEEAPAAEEKLWTLDVLSRGHRVLSSVPAFYAYVKSIPPSAAMRKNDRELRAIFEATGARLGAAQSSLTAVLATAVWCVLIGIPRAALNELRRAVIAVVLRTTFPRHASRPDALVLRRRVDDPPTGERPARGKPHRALGWSRCVAVLSNRWSGR